MLPAAAGRHGKSGPSSTRGPSKSCSVEVEAKSNGEKRLYRAKVVNLIEGLCTHSCVLHYSYPDVVEENRIRGCKAVPTSRGLGIRIHTLLIHCRPEVGAFSTRLRF